MLAEGDEHTAGNGCAEQRGEPDLDQERNGDADVADAAAESALQEE